MGTYRKPYRHWYALDEGSMALMKDAKKVRRRKKDEKIYITILHSYCNIKNKNKLPKDALLVHPWEEDKEGKEDARKDFRKSCA